MITYKKGKLSSCPENSILVYSCSTKEELNSNVTSEFQKKHPKEFRVYMAFCKVYHNTLGTSLIIPNKFNHNEVACLFTSKGYGSNSDSSSNIMINTKNAVYDLLFKMSKLSKPIACSYKLNTGLFGVKWELTEKLINECLDKYPNIEWIVYS